MEKVNPRCAGLDVHKDSIAIGIAEPGRTPGRVVGRIKHDVPKLLKQLTKLGGPSRVHVVYEAGPTGYGLQRKLMANGYECEVIAPSKMPRPLADTQRSPVPFTRRYSMS